MHSNSRGYEGLAHASGKSPQGKRAKESEDLRPQKEEKPSRQEPKMNEEELTKQLKDLRKILGRMEKHLARIMARGTREWICQYYDSVRRIPDYFTFTDWQETLRIVYDSLVEEINTDLTVRGMFQSGMPKTVLQVLEKEHNKLIAARKSKL